MVYQKLTKVTMANVQSQAILVIKNLICYKKVKIFGQIG